MAEVDQLILVVFSDNTIRSFKNTASPIPYRPRSNHYEVSSWSVRISDGLAEDYDLIKINNCPMTEAGVRCIVYLIADKTDISTIMTSLSADKPYQFCADNQHIQY